MSSRCVYIDELHDPRLDAYRDVRYRHSTSFGATFVAEGRLTVQRLLASSYKTLSVLVEQGREEWVAGLLSEDIQLLGLPRELLCELVGFRFHRGIMACGARPRWPSVQTLLRDREVAETVSDTLTPLAVAACGITDPENLGSILRSAAALGIPEIVLAPGTADPLARRVLRVSMGAAFKLRFYESTDFAADLRDLVSRAGIRVVATSLSPAAMPLHQYHADGRPTIVLLGNEAVGLSAEVQREATDVVTIPMHRGTDSLNVAVAAGIVLYELTRKAEG